jgi:hypothetical protein
VLLGFAAVCAVLVTISAGLVGWEGLLRYPAFALRVANAPEYGGLPPSFLPNLRGLIAGWPFYFLGTVGALITALISIGLLVFAAWKGRFALNAEQDADQDAEQDADQPALQFSLAVAVSVVIAWQTNIYDFSLLLLPLVLIADYSLRANPRRAVHRLDLLSPMLPALISPLWLVLWLRTGKVNLMAIPVLVWIWMIGRELSGSREQGIGNREQRAVRRRRFTCELLHRFGWG